MFQSYSARYFIELNMHAALVLVYHYVVILSFRLTEITREEAEKIKEWVEQEIKREGE